MIDEMRGYHFPTPKFKRRPLLLCSVCLAVALLFLWAFSLPRLFHTNRALVPPANDLQQHDSDDSDDSSNSNRNSKSKMKMHHLLKREAGIGKARLIFFGKPMMQALRRICAKKGWRVAMIPQADQEGARELQRLASQPDMFSFIFTSSSSFRHPILERLSNSSNTLVSAIKHASAIAGAKKGQLLTLRSFFKKQGCKLQDLNLMPRSFLLNEPSECKEFFRYSQLRPSSWWILKPSVGYGGKGITVHKNMSYFYNRHALCHSNHDTKEEFIVQEYLHDLLLVEGRKFDVRAFALIAGTDPYVLFYHPGYLRLAMEKFSSDAAGGGGGGGEGGFMHLTNSHIQQNSQNFSVDKHIWSFQQFQDYLDMHHPANAGFVANRLEPAIKKAALLVLQAGLPVLERHPSSFQLLGLDFMVTKDLHTWFIEANGYPLWPYTASSSSPPFPVGDMIETMGKDMFELLLKLREDPNHFNSKMPGDNFKSFQLIWNEHHSASKHNPWCSEF